jgi:hypothetical protein
MKLLAAILAVWLLLATPSAARAQTSQPLHRITGKREVMPGHKSASRRSPRSPFLGDFRRATRNVCSALPQGRCETGGSPLVQWPSNKVRENAFPSARQPALLGCRWSPLS